VTGRPILTAAAMRAAEDEAITAGTPSAELMERAGAAAAEAAWRFSGGAPALVLCGPGNNGGDGYVVARLLAERGVSVSVAALAPARTEDGSAMAARWSGPVTSLDEAMPARLVVDALFGTGLSRGLDPAVADRLAELVAAADFSVAIDLPSGVSTDDGTLLSPVPRFDLTITFAAMKPAHRLQPAAACCGRVIVADIGVPASSMLSEIGRPSLPPPGPEDHKYSRGMVAVLSGAMPGAAELAAEAALRGGAGYVLLAGGEPGIARPLALVRRSGDAATLLDDSRIGAVVIGPGLGREDAGRRLLGAALDSGHPLVIDADALVLLGAEPARLRGAAPAILTPHEGEFARLFGTLSGSRLHRAHDAAALCGAVVVLKGPDTIVAAPDGRAAIAPPASPWLATAGTGDVLSGITGAMLSRGLDPFDAACAAVWLHGAAARAAGPGLIADDLAQHLPAVLAACG
jgi:hydroxyethylthiazole kinase-like uncharacterized protein yjeF